MNSNQKQIIPHWNARQVVFATLLVVAVFIGFWLILRFHMMLVVLFASIVFGTALKPFVDFFVSRGWKRPFGLIFTYAILLIVLLILLLLVVPTIVQQSMDLVVSLPKMYLGLRDVLMKSSSVVLWNIGFRMPENLNLILNAVPVNSEPLNALTNFLGLSGTFLTGFLVIGGVFLLTTFWVLESEHSLRVMLLMARPESRTQIKELWQAIESRLAAFVSGQLILMFSIGMMALIAYLIIGLPNALVLALIAGVLEAVPVLGPLLGAVPAMLVAYSSDPIFMVWVVVSTGIIQTFENYLLVPRVMGASVGVNPITTLLILAAFGSLLGLPGALFAVPSAAVIQLLVDRFILTKSQNIAMQPAGRDSVSALRYEVQDLIGDVRKQLRRKNDRSINGNDEIEDSIETLAVELDLFLSQENEGDRS